MKCFAEWPGGPRECHGRILPFLVRRGDQDGPLVRWLCQSHKERVMLMTDLDLSELSHEDATALEVMLI